MRSRPDEFDVRETGRHFTNNFMSYSIRMFNSPLKILSNRNAFVGSSTSKEFMSKNNIQIFRSHYPILNFVVVVDMTRKLVSQTLRGLAHTFDYRTRSYFPL